MVRSLQNGSGGDDKLETRIGDDATILEPVIKDDCVIADAYDDVVEQRFCKDILPRILHPMLDKW